MRKLMAAIVASTGLVMAQGVQAAASAPGTSPTLTGETLTGPAGGTVDNHVHCNPDGTGFITFSATGFATGPYQGTFRERGVVSVTQRNGVLYENFFARFTIDSVTPRASVTGTTAEIPPETFPGLECKGYQLFQGYSSVLNDFPDRYQALIRKGGADGRQDGEGGNGRTSRDEGTTNVTVILSCDTIPCSADQPNFLETFTSTRAAA